MIWRQLGFWRTHAGCHVLLWFVLPDPVAGAAEVVIGFSWRIVFVGVAGDLFGDGGFDLAVFVRFVEGGDRDDRRGGGDGGAPYAVVVLSVLAVAGVPGADPGVDVARGGLGDSLLLRNTRRKLFWGNGVVLFAFREKGGQSRLRSGTRCAWYSPSFFAWPRRFLNRHPREAGYGELLYQRRRAATPWRSVRGSLVNSTRVSAAKARSVNSLAGDWG